MENVSKSKGAQSLVSTTYTISGESVAALTHDIMDLGANPTQAELAEVLHGHELKEICAVDNLGGRISGSAERAVAAALNVYFPPEKMTGFTPEEFVAALDEGDDFVGCTGWFNVAHGDNDKRAKDLAPKKREIFAAWDSSNNSTKWRRVRQYGAQLAYRDLYTPEEQDAHKRAFDTAMGEAGEAGEDGETGGKPSRNRDLFERGVVDQGTLYRAWTSAANDDIIKNHAQSEKIRNSLVHLTHALEALGAPLDDEELVAFMKKVTKR